MPDQSTGGAVGPIMPIHDSEQPTSFAKLVVTVGPIMPIHDPEHDSEQPTRFAKLVVTLGPRYEVRQSDEASESAGTSIVTVSIYLADEDIHEQVETAVEQWLGTANVSIETREDPVIGSWSRRMVARLRGAAGSPVGREALLTAMHVADSRLIQGQDAYVTATLLQNLGPVLTALQPTKDAVIRSGALLILKVNWVVNVYQLTAAQQAVLDHQPQLAATPEAIYAALQITEQEEREVTLPAVAQSAGDGKTTA